MRIDHLVWYNPDLAAGRNFFASRMDAEPFYGGEHPGEGTANAVLSLGPETYLEILGRDLQQNEGNLDPEIRSFAGPSLYHWAVGGVDLEALAMRAEAAGLTGGAIVEGGRRKPDGTWLGWRCWGLHNHGAGALIPFFIDWMGSEHPAASAPRGGRLAGLEILTPQVDEVSRIFDVLGIEVGVRRADKSSILAVLESSKGRTEIQSAFPLPRGYVI